MTGWLIAVRRLIPWLAMALAAIVLAACETDKPTADTATISPGSPPPPPPAKPYDPGNYKVGSPYQIAGKWYYPKVDLAYNERGVASWYGPNFHGKKTANGEIFDMTKIGAAHKTLPLPSVVRVTNLENGRSLVVRINDRGPFVRGRIIDLSRRAAQLLGFTRKGTAMVHVRLLPDESRRAATEAGATGKQLMAYGAPAPKASPSIPVTVENLKPVEGVAVSNLPPLPATSSQPVTNVAAPAEPPPYGAMTAIAKNGPKPSSQSLAISSAEQVTNPAPDSREAQSAPIDVATLPSREKVELLPVDSRPSIFIQAGAFRKYINANRLRARLTSLGHPVNVSQVYVSNQPFFRVRLGPMTNVEDADIALERVVVLGYPEARIVVD